MTALRECVRGAVNGDVQQFLRMIRAVGKYVTYCLKAKHQRMKTLKQRIMQVLRDTHALRDSPFKDQKILFGDLAHTDPVSKPGKKQRGHDAARPEPPRLPQGWC